MRDLLCTFILAAVMALVVSLGGYAWDHYNDASRLFWGVLCCTGMLLLMLGVCVAAVDLARRRP